MCSFMSILGNTRSSGISSLFRRNVIDSTIERVCFGCTCRFEETLQVDGLQGEGAAVVDALLVAKLGAFKIPNLGTT